MYPSLVAEEAKLALTEYLPDRLALTDDEARQRPRAMSQVPISLSAANLSGHLSLIHISEPTRPRLISYAVFCLKKIFLMIRRPPRSTPLYSSAASDVYKRQR